MFVICVVVCVCVCGSCCVFVICCLCVFVCSCCPRGPMDKASAYEAGDCGFESRRRLSFFFFLFLSSFHLFIFSSFVLCSFVSVVSVVSVVLLCLLFCCVFRVFVVVSVLSVRVHSLLLPPFSSHDARSPHSSFDHPLLACLLAPRLDARQAHNRGSGSGVRGLCIVEVYACMYVCVVCCYVLVGSVM